MSAVLEKAAQVAADASAIPLANPAVVAQIHDLVGRITEEERKTEGMDLDLVRAGARNLTRGGGFDKLIKGVFERVFADGIAGAIGDALSSGAEWFESVGIGPDERARQEGESRQGDNVEELCRAVDECCQAIEVTTETSDTAAGSMLDLVSLVLFFCKSTPATAIISAVLPLAVDGLNGVLGTVRDRNESIDKCLAECEARCRAAEEHQPLPPPQFDCPPAPEGPPPASPYPVESQPPAAPAPPVAPPAPAAASPAPPRGPVSPVGDAGSVATVASSALPPVGGALTLSQPGPVGINASVTANVSAHLNLNVDAAALAGAAQASAAQVTQVAQAVAATLADSASAAECTVVEAAHEAAHACGPCCTCGSGDEAPAPEQPAPPAEPAPEPCPEPAPAAGPPTAEGTIPPPPELAQVEEPPAPPEKLAAAGTQPAAVPAPPADTPSPAEPPAGGGDGPGLPDAPETHDSAPAAEPDEAARIKKTSEW